MPKKQQDYQCFRCGYTTSRKDNMHTHLHKLIKLCPPVLNTIELSETIKEKILKNRVYVVDDSRGVDRKAMNNYNFLSNIVLQMDSIDKLDSVSRLLNYDLEDFETVLEKCFDGNIKRLEDKSFKSAYVLSEANIF